MSFLSTLASKFRSVSYPDAQGNDLLRKLDKTSGQLDAVFQQLDTCNKRIDELRAQANTINHRELSLTVESIQSTINGSTATFDEVATAACAHMHEAGQYMAKNTHNLYNNSLMSRTESLAWRIDRSSEDFIHKRDAVRKKLEDLHVLDNIISGSMTKTRDPVPAARKISLGKNGR